MQWPHFSIAPAIVEAVPCLFAGIAAGAVASLGGLAGYQGVQGFQGVQGEAEIGPREWSPRTGKCSCKKQRKEGGADGVPSP